MEAEALYYVMYNDKVKGPFTFAQMQHFVLTNQISRTTFVMRKGANSWESAEQIAGLFPRIPEVPVNATPPVPSFEQKETGWENAEPLVGTFSKTPEVPVNTSLLHFSLFILQFFIFQLKKDLQFSELPIEYTASSSCKGFYHGCSDSQCKSGSTSAFVSFN